MGRLNRINLSLEHWKARRVQAWKAYRSAAESGRSCGWEWDQYVYTNAMVDRLEKKLSFEGTHHNRWLVNSVYDFIEHTPWLPWVILVVVLALTFWRSK